MCHQYIQHTLSICLLGVALPHTLWSHTLGSCRCYYCCLYTLWAPTLLWSDTTATYAPFELTLLWSNTIYTYAGMCMYVQWCASICSDVHVCAVMSIWARWRGQYAVWWGCSNEYNEVGALKNKYKKRAASIMWSSCRGRTQSGGAGRFSQRIAQSKAQEMA